MLEEQVDIKMMEVLEQLVIVKFNSDEIEKIENHNLPTLKCFIGEIQILNFEQVKN